MTDSTPISPAETDDFARNSNGTFAKGNKGGPGRPSLAEALAKIGAEVDPESGVTLSEKSARAMWDQACKGNVRAFAEIADRTEGKVAQTVDLGNKDGEPFEVNNGSFDPTNLTLEQLEALRGIIAAGTPDAG